MVRFLVPLMLLLAAALVGLLLLDRWRSARLRERMADRILDLPEPEAADTLWRDAASLLQLTRMRSLVGQSPLMRRLALRLVQGDVPLRLGQAGLLLFASAGLGAGLGVLLGRGFGISPGGMGVGGALLLPLALWSMLDAWTTRRIERRERQLPNFCTQMLSSLRTGATPLTALQAAARISPDPLGRSLRSLVDVLQLGVSPNVAWRDWAQRCGGDHAQLLATGLRLKWEAGGQMTSMLAHILESMQTRERMILRVGTLTAQAKLGSYVLSLLPVGFMIFSYLVNKRIYDFVMQDPVGPKVLLGGAGLVIVGFFWLRRLAKLKF